MQTFLPYPSFAKSASVLDNSRLANQRNECRIILDNIRGFNTGWVYHPAVKMWMGYHNALVDYTNEIIDEWIRRGGNHTGGKMVKINGLSDNKPHWLGDKAFHDGHKAALLRKSFLWYSKFDWKLPLDTPFVWPVE